MEMLNWANCRSTDAGGSFKARTLERLAQIMKTLNQTAFCKGCESRRHCTNITIKQK